MKRRFIVALTAFSAVLVGASGTLAEGSPTCSDSTLIDVSVHGQHIVGDYVAGIGHTALGWPPAGGVVGEALKGRGAALPGGPGPSFHFTLGLAPGASFCNSQAHPSGFEVPAPHR
jgi:hypothetical protein